MLFSTAILTSLATAASAYVLGQDVSAYQGTVDWAAQKSAGSQFTFIKATEGVSFTSSYFSSQYTGSYNEGIIRGAYHFARPDVSTGAEQATYFLQNGGGWSNDGLTLPGALDIEYNPYGATCYGLSASDMVAWIQDFGESYKATTGRYPVIYTTTDWWTTCTGNNGGFGDYPLWIARYASDPGTLPNGWEFTSFWQFNDAGVLAGDNDYWNGSEDNLSVFAKG